MYLTNIRKSIAVMEVKNNHGHEQSVMKKRWMQHGQGWKIGHQIDNTDLHK